jgi:HEAT repeat protein
LPTQDEVKRLVDVLAHGPMAQRRTASAALIAMGGEAVPGLVALLCNADISYAWAIVQCMVQIHDERCIDPFAALARNSQESFRRTAIDYLGRSGSWRATEALCRALADEDGLVCESALRGLQSSADPAAVGHLVRVAHDPKASVHVETALRRAIEKTAWNVSEEDLRAAIQLSDSYVLVYAQIESSCTFTTYNISRVPTDFTQVKQLARQELIRRGLTA